MSKIKKPILLDETGQRMAEALENLVDKLGTHTLTIIASAEDDVPIAEQLIKIYNLDRGVVYGEVVYNSPTAITVKLPHGFSYEVVPVVTMEGHYCTDRPSGIITEDTTVTLTYKTLGSMETFEDLKAICDAGLSKHVKLGESVHFTHDEFGRLDFDIVDYDASEESFTLLMHDVLNPQFDFDAKEALYYANSELPAGAYSFKVSNTAYYFTLTKTLPVGGQIVATASAFKTYTDAYAESAIEEGIVSTTAISDATELGATGSATCNHWDRVNYGSNDYEESALRQWIIGNGYNWWKPMTHFDRPPTWTSRAGFCAGVPQSVLDAIDTAEVKCVANTVYSAPDSHHTKGQQYQLHDKFYLASESEMFGSTMLADGSHQFGLFIGSKDADRIKRYGTSARYWWLRSSLSSYTNSERFVNASGAVDYYYAVYAISVALACKISKSV